MTDKLGTEHLPTEAVEVPFTLAIWSMTNKEDPRKGAISVGLLFGDRDNPTNLTPAERSYILACLDYVANEVQAGEIPSGGKGTADDWESEYLFAGYPPYARSERADK